MREFIKNSRALHYFCLVAGVSLLWVTQVAIPDPCDEAGSWVVVGRERGSASGAISFLGETVLQVRLDNGPKCGQCTKVFWSVAEQGTCVTATIGDQSGENTLVTLDSGGCQTIVVDRVDIFGSYEDRLDLPLLRVITRGIDVVLVLRLR